MSAATTMKEPPADPLLNGSLAKWFWALAAGLFVMNVALGLATVPDWRWLLISLGVLSGALTLAAPLTGLFLAASGQWGWPKALGWLAGGVAVHAGLTLAIGALAKSGGVLLVLCQAGAQTGLLVWAAGLGACIALIIKDKNLILPVCIFLAGFDTWLIMNPYVFTNQLVANNAQVFQAVAMKAPAARPAPKPDAKPEERAPRVEPFAYIGPADLIFCMTFFVVLFRFGMRVRQTLMWLIPVLIGYLVLVFLLPIGMLPALVPIGITVLAVNLREFKLTRDEQLGTWLIAAVAVGLAATGLYLRWTYSPPKRPTAPAIEGYSPDAPPPAGLPEPASPDRSQL